MRPLFFVPLAKVVRWWEEDRVDVSKGRGKEGRKERGGVERARSKEGKERKKSEEKRGRRGRG